MKSTHRFVLPLIAGALVAGSAFAATPATRDDLAQLKADQAALQRQIKRLESDEAILKADAAAGRMSAESKDTYEVYLARQAVKGEQRDIAADKTASLQMKADKDALHRQLKRLELAEARLKADTREGRMAAESKDAERVYKDQQAVKAEEKQVAADKAKMKTDKK